MTNIKMEDWEINDGWLKTNNFSIRISDIDGFEIDRSGFSTFFYIISAIAFFTLMQSFFEGDYKGVFLMLVGVLLFSFLGYKLKYKFQKIKINTKGVTYSIVSDSQSLTELNSCLIEEINKYKAR